MNNWNYRNRLFHPVWRSVCAVALLCVVTIELPQAALAEEQKPTRSQAKIEPPKSAFSVLNIFDGSLPIAPAPTGKVVEVADTKQDTSSASSNDETRPADDVAPSEKASISADANSSIEATVHPTTASAEFVSADPKSHIVPPSQDPRVRINPEAPGPFKAMASAFQEGDIETAKAYADQYVRYQINLMFEVRELTKLIGEALVRQGLVDDEEMVGVDQYIDITFARARTETSSAVRPTHKHAMERIKPDPEHKAEIYYFFSLNCSWCRQMTPDVERLWQISKSDKNIKFVAAVIGNSSPEWIESYRSYTGLTAPIMNGNDAAKALRIGVVPAVLVVSPTQETSYLKTGQQPFDRLYEFLRTVQGLPATLTPQIEKLLKTPIGYEEKQNGVATVLPSLPVAAKPAAGPTLTPVSEGNGGSAKRGTVDRF